MTEADLMVRVIEVGNTGDWSLVVGQTVISYKQSKQDAERLAEPVRIWLGRQLNIWYGRFSAELRERMRWRTGYTAAETMEQVVRLAVDMEEVRADNFMLKSKIEQADREGENLRDQLVVRMSEIEALRKELQAAQSSIHEYRKALHAIAEASHDTASKAVAGGILYTEGV